MSLLEQLGLVALFSLVLGLPYYLKSRRPRVEFPAVPPELRDKLGDELATLLVATRDLRSELLAFETASLEMLEEERAELLPTGHRPFAREMADANFLDHVESLRRKGKAWLELATVLPEPERARLGLELEPLLGLFELPWSLERSREERVRDRSPEIRGLLENCRAAQRLVAEFDGVLSVAPSAYR